MAILLNTSESYLLSEPSFPVPSVTTRSSTKPSVINNICCLWVSIILGTLRDHQTQNLYGSWCWRLCFVGNLISLFCDNNVQVRLFSNIRTHKKMEDTNCFKRKQKTIGKLIECLCLQKSPTHSHIEVSELLLLFNQITGLMKIDQSEAFSRLTLLPLKL